jgi:hypothetical protein
MPRASRYTPGGMVFHVLNRGVGRRTLFDKDADYLAFQRVMEETLRTRPMRICAYCLMPNHWHFILWPKNDGDLAAFMQQLTNLADWPLPRPANWTEIVNRPQSEAELEVLRKCVNRGRPLGDENWTALTARMLGIEFTLRTRGRPRQRA